MQPIIAQISGRSAYALAHRIADRHTDLNR
jgi:hypothetical protein